MIADPRRHGRCRRQFLLAAAGLASSSFCAATLPAVAEAGPDVAEAGPVVAEAAEAGPIALRPSRHQLYRVRIELEIEGNVDVPNNPLVSTRGDVKLPIRSNAAFEYEERYHHGKTKDLSGRVPLIERYYYQAESNSELNRRSQMTTLRDSVRSTIVRRQTLPPTVYTNEDSLRRDELELLRTPVCSAAVDQLLPADAVREGDQYRPSANVMMSVLNLGDVQSTDVIADVVSIGGSEVRLKLRGDVQGSVDGVPTMVRVAGKLTFHRQQATCTWLAMAVHETRDAGKAEPGFDVAGTIKMIRKPVNRPAGLPVTKPTIDLSAPIPQDRLFVALQSDQLGFGAMMNRNWRMMTDIPGAAMMRMIDNEQSIAQCDFRPLATLAEGQQWTLEALQQDVKQTLADQLTSLVGSDQQRSSSGLHVMRVVARGAVADVPIQWVVLHFSDDSGRRVLATFTMEGEHVEAFAGSDDQLIGSLRFLELKQSAEHGVAAARDGGPRTAANPHAAATENIPSASDFR